MTVKVNRKGYVKLKETIIVINFLTVYGSQTRKGTFIVRVLYLLIATLTIFTLKTNRATLQIENECILIVEKIQNIKHEASRNSLLR